MPLSNKVATSIFSSTEGDRRSPWLCLMSPSNVLIPIKSYSYLGISLALGGTLVALPPKRAAPHNEEEV